MGSDTSETVFMSEDYSNQRHVAQSPLPLGELLSEVSEDNESFTPSGRTVKRRRSTPGTQDTASIFWEMGQEDPYDTTPCSREEGVMEGGTKRSKRQDARAIRQAKGKGSPGHVRRCLIAGNDVATMSREESSEPDLGDPKVNAAWMEHYRQEAKVRSRRRSRIHAEDTKAKAEEKHIRHKGRKELGAKDSDTSIFSEYDTTPAAESDASIGDEESEPERDDDGSAAWGVTQNRQGWCYDKKSCHVDSVLMAEMAVDTMSPKRWNELEDEETTEEGMLRRAVRGLAKGRDLATLYRNELRRYEVMLSDAGYNVISLLHYLYRHWDPDDLRWGGLVKDVVFNMERVVLTELRNPCLRKGHILWDRTVVTMESRILVEGTHRKPCPRIGRMKTTCQATKCKDTHCHPVHPQRRVQAVLKIELVYYNFPDCEAAPAIICRGGMQEAVRRRLACPDAGVHDCQVPQCTAKWKMVKGHMVGLPRVLVIGTEDEKLRRHDLGCKDWDIKVFGKKYALAAVVFYQGSIRGTHRSVAGHYFTRFKVGDLWYEYDDMLYNKDADCAGMVLVLGRGKYNHVLHGSLHNLPRLWFYVAKNGRSEQVSTKEHTYKEGTFFQSHFHQE